MFVWSKPNADRTFDINCDYKAISDLLDILEANRRNIEGSLSDIRHLTNPISEFLTIEESDAIVNRLLDKRDSINKWINDLTDICENYLNLN